MKSLGGFAGWLLLIVVAGCHTAPETQLYEYLAQDYRDPGAQALKEDLAGLPFHNVVWEYKFTDKDISRLTLGTELLYVETPDARVLAVDRFTGVTRWIFEVDTHHPLDFPPAEAYRVPDEIRRYEAEIQALNRRIDDLVKEKGPGKESQDVQKKRDQVRQHLREAQNGDNVYLISKGVLYCLVRTTGTLQWTRRLHKEFAPAAQPFAVRSRIFVPGADSPRVWALDVERKGVSVTSYRTMPSAGDKTILGRAFYEDPSLYFVCGDGNVYCYNIQGGLSWTYATEGPLRADPILHIWREMTQDDKGKDVERETRVLFVGGLDGALYALDATNKELIWKYEAAGPILQAPVVRDGTVYVKTEDGALFALEVNPQHRNPKTGKAEGPRRSGILRWKLPLGERFVVKGRDHVYVLGPNSELYRLKESDGAILGRYPLKRLTQIVTNTIDDMLYVAHPSGYLFALRESRE